MNSEFIAMLDYLEREKGIKRESSSRRSRTPCSRPPKRRSKRAGTCAARSTRKAGEIRAVAKLIVAERVTNKHDEISLSECATGQDRMCRSARRSKSR